MSITTLNIFEKDTDASASIRGYEYQLLLTLKEWVENFLQRNGDTLYCEYGDDIAVFNSIASTIKFKQVKSYSNDFSFQSKEVRKALLNFFMIYANPSYLQHEPSFVFETNAGVISGSNEESKFLAEWAAARAAGLKDADIQKIILKVKSLVIEEISQQADDKLEAIRKRIEILETKKPSGFQDDLAELRDREKKILEGKNYTIALTDDTYADFINKIDWKFHDKEPVDAIAELKDEIEHLISKLPFNINQEKIPVIFTILRWEVSKKAINKDPIERRLDADLLTNTILGAEDEKWYVDLKKKFEGLNSDQLTLGDFFELRGAARHARFTDYLHGDIPFWISILQAIVGQNDFPKSFRRIAIYELCFLAFFKKKLDEFEILIIEFFEQMESFTSTDDLENTVILLSIVFSAGRLKISKSYLTRQNEWRERIIKVIEIEQQKENTPTRKANLFDLRAQAALQLEIHDDYQAAIDRGLKNLNEVVALLDDATLFPVHRLSNQLNVFINDFIDVDPKLANTLERLANSVDDALAKKDGKFSLAKASRDRALMHFKKNQYIKAIEYFHKAKLYWFSDEGIKGTIIASALLSSSYNNLRLHYAGKYYGFATASLVSSSPSLKGVESYFPRGMAMAALSDYMASAWLSFFDSADLFLTTHFKIEGKSLDIAAHEEFREVLFAAVTIQSITERLYPDFLAFVNFRISRWHQIPTDILTALKDKVTELSKEKTDEELVKWLSGRINQTPFNDAGGQRVVRWEALGVCWEVHFANDYITTSLAEQFIAMFQILQTDLSQEDFCILKTKVSIQVEHTPGAFSFKELTATPQHKWLVKIPSSDQSGQDHIRQHYFPQIALMFTTLSYVSLIRGDVGRKIFEDHVKDEMGSKVTPVKPYEQLYREIIPEELFKQSKRESFRVVDDHRVDPRIIAEIAWKKDESALYDAAFAKKAIAGRYQNCLRAIHITLEKLKSTESFIQTVEHFRKLGWKDWHILMAMYQAIMNYKANSTMPPGGNQKDFERAFDKLRDQDEETCYMEIPTDVFSISNLEEQFHLFIVPVLRSYKLEYKAHFVEFDALLDLVTKRFKFMDDDVDHENCFKPLPK
jgi:hypothetical protein